MKGSRHLGALGCIVVMVACVTPAARAAGTGGGSIQFSLTADLNPFPCAPPGCGGSFSGTSVGSLAGVDGNNPWAVQWIPQATGGPSVASGSFTYADSCAIPIGVAQGSGTVTADVGFVTGTYGPAAGSVALPYPVVGVDSSFSFEWSRIGLSAVVTTSISVTIKVAKPSVGIVSIPVVTNHLDVAVAAFAPTGAVPSCASPGRLTAVVAASDQIALT